MLLTSVFKQGWMPLLGWQLPPNLWDREVRVRGLFLVREKLVEFREIVLANQIS